MSARVTYARPTDLDDALHIIATTDSLVIAGATDVYPAMGAGPVPAQFLDITQVAGLTGISVADGRVRIGAATPWSDVATADLPPACDALRQAALQVGSVQIQNAGTVAGNLCNASPAADGVPPLLVLEADVELASRERGLRVVPLQDFLTGVRQTVRAADELVTAVRFPVPEPTLGSAFEKLGSRAYLVISIAMTAAVVGLDGAGRIAEARVAVGACSPVAQRLHGLEAQLVGQDPSRVEVMPEHLAGLSPISDVRGNAGYRLAAVPEQIARAVARAAGRE